MANNKQFWSLRGLRPLGAINQENKNEPMMTSMECYDTTHGRLSFDLKVVQDLDFPSTWHFSKQLLSFVKWLWPGTWMVIKLYQNVFFSLCVPCQRKFRSSLWAGRTSQTKLQEGYSSVSWESSSWSCEHSIFIRPLQNRTIQNNAAQNYYSSQTTQVIIQVYPQVWMKHVETWLKHVETTPFTAQFVSKTGLLE